MRLTDEQKSAKKYDSQTQDVINYIDDETKYLNKSLKHTKPLQKTLYDEMVGRIKKDDQSVPYLENGYYYYVRYEDKKEYPIYCRKYKKGSIRLQNENVLKLMRDFGYKTFDNIFDESYDLIEDRTERANFIAKEMQKFIQLGKKQKLI